MHHTAQLGSPSCTYFPNLAGKLAWAPLNSAGSGVPLLGEPVEALLKAAGGRLLDTLGSTTSSTFSTTILLFSC